MSFVLPAAIAKHNAFKENVTRQEAEFLLSLPGWRFVLRLNADKNRVVVTYTQKSGVIGHSEIDVDAKGRVVTAFRTYDNVDLFVKDLISTAAGTMPTPAQLRKIAELSSHVYDAISLQQVEEALAAKSFVLRLSNSLADVWVLSFKKRGPTVHVPIRSTTMGFTVDGLDGEFFGNFVSIIERLGLRSKDTGKKVSAAAASSSVYMAVGNLENELQKAAVVAESQREQAQAAPRPGIYESVNMILAQATASGTTLYGNIEPVASTPYELLQSEPLYDIVEDPDQQQQTRGTL